MRPCVSLSLPFLGHTAVARFSPPEELIPIYRAPCRRRASPLLSSSRGKFCSPGRHQVVLHVTGTSQRSLASYLKFSPSLPKLDQTHFLPDDSGFNRNKALSGFLPSGIQFGNFPLPLPHRNPHTWNYFLSGFSLQI